MQRRPQEDAEKDDVWEDCEEEEALIPRPSSSKDGEPESAPPVHLTVSEEAERALAAIRLAAEAAENLKQRFKRWKSESMHPAAAAARLPRSAAPPAAAAARLPRSAAPAQPVRSEPYPRHRALDSGESTSNK